MIDITAESLLTLAEAAASLPSQHAGKRVHLSTILRWILNGVKARTGELVRLEAVRLGRAWFTSREALKRFAAKLTPDLEGTRPPAPRTAGARERAAEQAGRKLDRIGI